TGSSAAGCLRPVSAILIRRAVCASPPKARAVCGKSARTDPRGGYGEIRIPTATPLLPVRSTAKKLNPATALREHQKAAPHRARIATLHGLDRRRNRDRKAPLIAPGSRRGSAASSPPESGQGSAAGFTPPDR